MTKTANKSLLMRRAHHFKNEYNTTLIIGLQLANAELRQDWKRVNEILQSLGVRQ